MQCDWKVNVLFLDMLCMEMVYKDQKGDGELVSSQSQRAAVVLRINRSSTARCVPDFPDMPCMKRIHRDN